MNDGAGVLVRLNEVIAVPQLARGPPRALDDATRRDLSRITFGALLGSTRRGLTQSGYELISRNYLPHNAKEIAFIRNRESRSRKSHFDPLSESQMLFALGRGL